jgi:hypothetical protein
VLDSSLVLASNKIGWDVDQLVVDRDVSMSDLGSSLVDGVSELDLFNDGLESSGHEDFGVETQDVIDLVLGGSIQESIFVHSVEDSLSFEDSLWILFVQGQKSSRSLSKLCDGQLDSPDFSLVLKTVSTGDLNFRLDSLLLERSLWGFGGL